MKTLLITFLTLFSISFFSITGTGKAYRTLRSISMDDGLSSNKIISMTKDSIGTMWVGTSQGLDRIAGNRIFQYEHELFSGTNIHFVFKDKSGTIWAGTDAGLYRYDYLSDSFSQIKENGIAVIANSYDITDDAVYFNTNDGIIRWGYATRTPEIVYRRQDYNIGFKNLHILDGTYALVTIDDDGIYRFNLQTGKRELLHKTGSSDFITSCTVSQSGHLWVALYGKGIYCLSVENASVRCHIDSENSELENDIVLSIKEYDGKLWISTDGGGVSVMDPETLKISSLSEYLGYDINLQLHSVLNILKDGDDIWFGTVRHGIQGMSDKAISNISGENTADAPISNTDFVVQCFCEHPEGKIWIGTDGDGIHVFDPRSYSLEQLPAFRKEKVVSMAFADERKLLVSIYGKGIYLYDLTSGSRQKILIKDRETDHHIFSQDLIVELSQLHHGKVILFTENTYIFDSGTGRITEYTVPGLPASSGYRTFPSHGHNVLLSDGKDILRFDSESMTASLLYSSDRTSVTAAAVGKDRLWFTDASRLYEVDLITGNARQLPIKNKSKINTLAADRTGALWAVQYDRLIRLEPEDNMSPRFFDHADGVIPNDYYYPGIMLEASDGRLYFGGSRGVNVVDATKIVPENRPSRMSIISLIIDGRHAGYTQDRNEDRISVPWNYSSIEIRMCVQGDDIQKSRDFRYEIRKRGKTVKTVSGKSLLMPLLSPGTYNIHVYTEEGPDCWTEVPGHIVMDIVQPWWQTVLIVAILYVVVLGSIMLIVFLYHRKEKRKSQKIYDLRKKELSENKIRFLINMSHELRTPLTLIYAPLKRILQSEDLPGQYRKEIASAYHQSTQMTRIINIILDSRKFEEGYSTLIISPVNVNGWVQNIAEDFKIEYEAKGISIEYELDERVDTVNMDEAKCSMALSNLLMNAYKYSPSGTTVIIRTSLENSSVRISIIDHGAGISDSDIERLFKRFERNSSSANGFGLGLAYTKQIIEAHPGGYVGAAPNTDRGSTFYFGIPTKLTCSTIPAQPISGEDNPSCSDNTLDFDTSGCTLLVADDEPELLDFMVSALKDSFKEIITAYDGKDAYNKVRRHSPNIIISDVMMPEMNGYELCRHLKNEIEVSHIPVILLTAQADIRNRTEGYKSGADLFITKPFDILEIMTAVKNILANRTIIRDRYKSDFSLVSAVSCSFSNADEKFLKKLDAFILENLANSALDAPMITDHMCMSRSNFYKKMKELTDIGVKEYVNNIRLEQARILLQNNELQINDIAMQVGFADTQYFSKVFKSRFGMSPTAFRKNTVSGQD